MPGINNEIDIKKLKQLTEVIRDRELQAWTYTHKPLTAKNLKAIKHSITNGFVINASADNLEEADDLKKKGVPVVVLLSSDSPDTVFTPNGNKVVVCPAQRLANSNCGNCMLCQKSTRSVIVGFKAHGSAKRKIEKILTQK